MAPTFVEGFLHPVLGIDHLVAMVTLGLWAAQGGTRRAVALVLAFPAFAAGGAALARAGVPMPQVESGIAASALALGILVLTASRLPAVWGAALAGAFAVFHGHAHGTEVPAGADAVSFLSGFLAGTVALHAAGIALGRLARGRPHLLFLTRTAGGLACAAGAVFLVRALG
jgi:urease accessory protein